MYDAMLGVKDLVAASAAFQTKVGAADEAAALAFVHAPTIEGDDVDGPFAAVSLPFETRTGQSGHSNHEFDVLLYLPVPANATDAAAFAELLQWADAIRQEVMAEQWSGGRLVVRQIAVVDGPHRGRRRGGNAAGEAEEEGEEKPQQDFVQVTLGLQTGLVDPP
jgi:hypothetical protein